MKIKSHSTSKITQESNQGGSLKKQNITHNLDQSKQQLIQAERMASLGTVASGLAHEINNPLSFLLSNIESLHVYMKTFSDLLTLYQKLTSSLLPKTLDIQVQKTLQEIQQMRAQDEVVYMLGDYESLLNESLEGIGRIREVVQSLQNFSRDYGDEPQLVDVNECIKTALRVASNEFKYKCTLNKELLNLPRIYCNPGHLLQVFINLLLNAAQAIDERGLISVKTRYEHDNIYVEVADTGGGILPENLKNLFTPFFTTKPVGKGTGLGLSVSYGIVKALGGKIEVSTKLGAGSTFTVVIPVKSEVKNE